jgi:hypothetical protein
MWVTTGGNRNGQCRPAREYLDAHAGENMRRNERFGVSSPAIIAQGHAHIRWRMVECRARKDTGQACACPVSSNRVGDRVC